MKTLHEWKLRFHSRRRLEEQLQPRLWFRSHCKCYSVAKTKTHLAFRWNYIVFDACIVPLLRRTEMPGHLRALKHSAAASSLQIPLAAMKAVETPGQSNPDMWLQKTLA